MGWNVNEPSMNRLSMASWCHGDDVIVLRRGSIHDGAVHHVGLRIGGVGQNVPCAGLVPLVAGAGGEQPVPVSSYRNGPVVAGSGLEIRKDSSSTRGPARLTTGVVSSSARNICMQRAAIDAPSLCESVPGNYTLEAESKFLDADSRHENIDRYEQCTSFEIAFSQVGEYS